MQQKSRAGRVLTAKEFFDALPLALTPRLPIELRAYDSGRGHGRLLKLHYGQPQTHYECWHHTGAGRLEVGLHFEAGQDLNAEALAFFRARIIEIKADLPRGELEPWDRGWVRLYETIVAPELTDQLLTPTAEAMAAYIRTLQPLLDEFWRSREG